MSGSPAPASCAVCGADIPPGARACPECGADDRTGWREQSIYDGLDLPGAESGPGPAGKRQRLFWQIAGIVMLVVVVLLVLLNRFWIAP